MVFRPYTGPTCIRVEGWGWNKHIFTTQLRARNIINLALCAVLPRLQHPPGIPARDLCKITTHHNAYHVCSTRYSLIQLMVVNSWRLVYAFVAAKPFNRSHAESSLTRMIFFKKSTYLLVCPSLFHNFIPNETLEVFQGGHGTCKLWAERERALSSPTLLIAEIPPASCACATGRTANHQTLNYS